MAASDVTQKEPFLTGFSKHLYGSAKRSTQRSIQLFRKKALRDSTSSFARLFENILPAAWLAGIDPTRRIRDFPLILVFWAWFAQIIEGNASCSKALSMIQSWSVAAGCWSGSELIGVAGFLWDHLSIDSRKLVAERTRSGPSKGLSPSDRGDIRAHAPFSVRVSFSITP